MHRNLVTNFEAQTAEILKRAIKYTQAKNGPRLAPCLTTTTKWDNGRCICLHDAKVSSFVDGGRQSG